MRNAKSRECYFKECLAYYDGNETKLFYGYAHGQLATEIRGNETGSKWSELWYLFIPDNCIKKWQK